MVPGKNEKVTVRIHFREYIVETAPCVVNVKRNEELRIIHIKIKVIQFLSIQTVIAIELFSG